MTIEAIFERYEVPVQVREKALARAEFVYAVHDVWVGPQLDWIILVKAALFADLGAKETTAHVRKKVGLDKYVITVLAWAVPERLNEVLVEKDWYQMVHLFVAFRQDKEVAPAMATLRRVVGEQLLCAWSEVEQKKNMRDAVLAMEVFHYKNPSV